MSKLHGRQQHGQAEDRSYRSVFEVSKDFFDSCIILNSPSSSMPDVDVSQRSVEGFVAEPKLEERSIDNGISGFSDDNGNVKTMKKWSCSTCRAEFDSLQDQRLHFKSDLHRFNIKLTIAGKNAIKEEDFDETTSDMCKDYEISSISGSDNEDERENGAFSDRRSVFGGIFKSKIYVQLENGERVSVWKCLVLDETKFIQFGNEKALDRDGVEDSFHLTHTEMIEKLKCMVREPRDNTRVRIVLLARGGHFAGCVLDGNSLVAHKTFHRYVVRAKAGKKQSSKDASTRGIHSAGASLRRHNELGLKKDIQELIASWKRHFAVASCIFIHAPSNNRQIFYDGEKPLFKCPHNAIRNIPLTIRRPTFKEAMRVYGLLTQISSEISGETVLHTAEEVLGSDTIGNDRQTESSKMELTDCFEDKEIVHACSAVKETDDQFCLSLKTQKENDPIFSSTPLHEAASLGNTEKVFELLECGLDPCIKDERGRTPYMLASEKEVRDTFRRFMALNLEKWDWHAAQVPSALTKEMEEAQAVKQAEKDAKRKARAKELKKLRKAKEKKSQAEAAQSQNASVASQALVGGSNGSRTQSKEGEWKRTLDTEREKRAAAAERRLAAGAGGCTGSTSSQTGSDVLCSCCKASLAGKVPFHRYHYKYCSTSCMHVHKEILEDG